MGTNSLLSWAGIAEVSAALRLAPGGLLVDLACGRGGYGLEFARRSGARLAGLDISAVAIRAATAAASGGPAGAESSGGPSGALSAGFVVGDYTAAGLRDGCADAVVCVDAMQFADPPLAGLAECRRLLAPGGRVVITGWEALDPQDERQPERIRRLNLARDLAAAGFGQVTVTGKPDWLRSERALWESAAAAPDAAGDPGLTSLQDEARRALAVFDGKRRVMAVAEAE